MNSELEKLIVEQERDMRFGHRVSRPHVSSLDAIGYNLASKKISKFKIPLSPLDVRHGTEAGYCAGCRLSCCRSAHAKSRKERQLKLIAKTDFKDIPHGTINGYTNYACRCDDCKTVNAKHQREYQQRKREDELERLVGY